ncbi:hypothetical protein B0H66DRAFT_550783 [Apodospora peruviana]|uniref:Uncharacterized protein n=1 Tax=Apodospora peruviana TaxID=516989 RepID=A0AAE0MBI5_9PEZI|nr:hypothetical protein B0H66DRAFT_550783 [Apodospora peruviana]
MVCVIRTGSSVAQLFFSFSYHHQPSNQPTLFTQYLVSHITQKIIMSPMIAARVAAMRAAASTTSSRMVTRRQFSIIQSLRSFGRSIEAHPFERLPVTSQSAAADWGKLVKRTGKQGLIYFPAMCVMLGWPYAASVIASKEL